MPDDVVTTSQPEATAVPSAASRMAAVEAKIQASQPAEMTGEGSSTLEESEDVGEEEAQTEPGVPKAKAKARAEAPKVRPLGGHQAQEEDAESDGEADIDRIAALERNVRKDARLAASERQQLQSQMAQFQRAQEQFVQERQQFQRMQQQLSTPEGILEWFEQNNGTGEKLGQYIVDANDPLKRSQIEAKRAIDPVAQELAAIKAQMAQMQSQRDEAAAANQLKSRLTELAGSDDYSDSVQHSATVLETDPDYFVQCANAACDRLAQTKVDAFGRSLPFDFDDVIVELEKTFKREASRYGARQTTGETPASKARSQPAQKLPAKAPAKLANQRNASGRTMMVDDEPGALPSLKERGAALERKLMGRTG